MLALAMVLALGFVAGTARAQNAGYPNRPIKMLVGFAAGGGTDVAARIMAQKMSKILGQSILVENRTGASGLIAARGRREIDARRLHADDGQPDRPTRWRRRSIAR